MLERAWSASRGLRNLVDRSENEPGLWAGRTELALRPEREVDLQGALQQEHPIDPRAACDIEVVNGSMFAVHPIGPIADRLTETFGIGDPKSEVDVGPSVNRTARR